MTVQNNTNWTIKSGEFSWALEWLKRGAIVQRKGWVEKNIWLCLRRPDEDSVMTVPYIYMYTAEDDIAPWTASQMDILAEDWQKLATHK